MKIIERIRVLTSLQLQMAIVIIVIFLMGFFIFLFVSNIERRHLHNDIKSTMLYAEAEIISHLKEPDSFLYSHSENVRSMILQGESMETVSVYISDITGYLLRDEEKMPGFIDFFCYIYKGEGVFLSGRNWRHPDEIIFQELPWYTAAVAAGGKPVISEPFSCRVTSRTVIAFSRYVTDNEGNPLGVICVEINPSIFYGYATVLNNFTQDSYGILVNENLTILAHPKSFTLGSPLYTVDREIAYLAEEMQYGQVIFGRKAKNYMYDSSMVFTRKIKNGWYIFAVIPVSEYYRNNINLVLFLVFLGSVMAALLCIVMYHVAQSRKKADIRTQQKSSFLATMSHEIRTPLNAILGMTEIQMQNTAQPQAACDAFIRINHSGNMLLNIINDILDLSKIEAGRFELIPAKYEVASMINDILQLCYIRYESKPIEFKVDVDEGTPTILVGDELRIKQILNNLLSNAFKYTERGEITLSAGAECVGRGGIVQVTLVFKVTDTGCGMTQEQISRLFDDYSRFNLEANRTTEGSGLGMTITRNLINLMQGKISVKSEVSKGTAVTVRLPQKTDGVGIRGVIGKELAENLGQYRLDNAITIKRAQITHEYMPYGSILVVDDVETNLYVAKGLMAPYGLKIELAASGFEAVEKVKQGNVYDIIFMDHMMPKMDGIETTKRIREMKYTHPIVALTANAIAGQADVFLSNGFDGFISKPIDVRQLNVSLNKLIRDKQPAEVLEAAQQAKAEYDKKYGASVHQQVDSQLAVIFVRDAEKVVAALEAALQSNFQTENDIHLYIINVHAMKSALANIGESELSATAHRLEKAGREKDIKVILSGTHSFLNELRMVINKNKPKDDENETIEDTEEALVYLCDKLRVIKEACSDFDRKTVKNILNELREKPWSQKTKELLSKIAEHLLHSEFDDIAALVNTDK